MIKASDAPTRQARGSSARLQHRRQPFSRTTTAAIELVAGRIQRRVRAKSRSTSRPKAPVAQTLGEGTAGRIRRTEDWLRAHLCDVELYPCHWMGSMKDDVLEGDFEGGERSGSRGPYPSPRDNHKLRA